MSFKDFNNTLNMVSFASLNSQVRWDIGSAAFTVVACWLMTRPDVYDARGVLIASGAGMRTIGYDLATALLLAWTGVSGVNALSRFGKSKTAVPYVEAKERGKASASPTVHAEKVGKVEVNTPEDRPRA